MKRKRLGALLLAVTLLLGVSAPALPAVGLATAAEAIPARDEGDQYFGNQLRKDPKAAEAAAFYEALVAMYNGGAKDSALLTGADQKVELSEAQVQAYLSGQSNLGHALSTARDAFYMDYPDLFYVNFNNFAMRVREGAVYITPGTRGTGYLLDGITAEAVPGLVKQYDDELDKLVKSAQSAEKKVWEQSDEAAQVRAVHDALAETLAYTLDNECAADNQKYIRTAYGLVTKEGVCEAYSRAFKSAMDELEIPCVLVEGVFRHSAERVEAHMWACVQVEEKWYGVDVTMDDPGEAIVNARGEKQADAVAYNDYLLAGDVTMGAQHAASPTMSAANYEFKYPTLTQNDYAVITLHNAGGLKVELDQSGDELDHEGEGGNGTFHVSYNNMSYTEAAKHGYYILAHFMSVNTDTQVGSKFVKGDYEWSQNEDWSYLAMDLYEGLPDGTTETVLPMPHVRYVQFAVTDVAPGDYKSLKGRTDLSSAELAEAIYDATHYQGDPALLLAKTEVLFNHGGDYVAPPYIKQAWPSQQSTLLIGHETYNIRVQLDEPLELEKEGTPLGYELTTYAFLNGKREDYSAEKYCTVGPLSLSADGTEITFTFQPSDKWAHDTIFYEFNFTGVVGKTSKKKPNSLVYLASHPCSAYAYQSQGFDWNLYGKPQLMDDFANSSVDISGWETRDGTPPKNALKHRMTLVVNKSSSDDSAKMNAMVEQKTGTEPLSYQTYSINLTVCKSQIVKTGQAVRVMLGFPEPYGPDDAGVTFKAYHYVMKDGHFTGEVEEIPCIVTPQGLLVLCDSFSPFNICAMPAAESTAPAAGKKTVVVSTNCGGKVDIVGAENYKLEDGTEAKGVYTIEPDKSYFVEIEAPEGQVISALTIGGKSIDLSKAAMPVPLTYADLQGLETGIVDVQFAPQSWIDRHVKDTVITLPQVEVSIPENLTVTAGSQLKIDAAHNTVPAATRAAQNEDGYVYAYRWFKDGKELPGHSGKSLIIPAAQDAAQGRYKVEVSLTAPGTGSTQMSTAESAECLVTVAAAPVATAPAQAPAATQEPEETPATPTPAPTPAPAAPAAPAATPTPKPASGSGNQTGGTVTAPAASTPAPTPAAPAPALTNTPAPTMPPATQAPQATAVPAPTPAPQAEKSGVPPLAVAGIAAAGLAVAGGLVWMFLPRRKHYHHK